MSSAILQLFSARDAKAKFGEVLDRALGRPVGITKHDRLTAYVVSKTDFEAMVSRIQYLEDQLWLMKADAARLEGFASADEVSAFLHNFRSTDNEVEHDQAGP
jgi:prevent-host-death family protein